MSTTTEDKVIDPESIKWIEQRRSREDDQAFFAEAWKRALREAQADLAPSAGER